MWRFEQRLAHVVAYSSRLIIRVGVVCDGNRLQFALLIACLSSLIFLFALVDSGPWRAVSWRAMPRSIASDSMIYIV